MIDFHYCGECHAILGETNEKHKEKKIDDEINCGPIFFPLTFFFFR